MSVNKTSNIIIRVSEEEKKKAAELSIALGNKNLSDFFRTYVNDLYDLIYPANNSFDFNSIINDLEEEYKKEKGYKKFSLQVKINTLKEIMENYSK